MKAKKNKSIKIALLGLSVLMITSCNKTYQCTDIATGNISGEVKARSSQKAQELCGDNNKAVLPK